MPLIRQDITLQSGSADYALRPFASKVQASTTNISNYIDSLEFRIEALERNQDSLIDNIKRLDSIISNNPIQYNSFMQGIINKIEILKNIIKRDMPDDQFISINLSEVEYIESEIISVGKITQKQMLKLNDIYSRLNK